MKLQDIPIFVVTLKENDERRDRLAKRLLHLDLLDQTHFVIGYDQDSELVKYYSYRKPDEKRVYSCTINHFFALKSFLKTKASENLKSEYALILEDDAIFDKDFRRKFTDNIPEDTKENLIMLGWTHGPEYNKQIHPKIGLNLITNWTYGALAYLIHRDYAIKVLALFDRPGINLLDQSRNTSEVITIFSKGKYLNPPIVLEEALASTMGHNYKSHLEWFNQYANLLNFLTPKEDPEVIKVFQGIVEKDRYE